MSTEITTMIGTDGYADYAVLLHNKAQGVGLGLKLIPLLVPNPLNPELLRGVLAVRVRSAPLAIAADDPTPAGSGALVAAWNPAARWKKLDSVRASKHKIVVEYGGQVGMPRVDLLREVVGAPYGVYADSQASWEAWLLRFAEEMMPAEHADAVVQVMEAATVAALLRLRLYEVLADIAESMGWALPGEIPEGGGQVLAFPGTSNTGQYGNPDSPSDS